MENAGDPQANGDGTWSLVMDEDKGLVGRFAPNLYTVTLTIEGDGEVQNQPGNPYLQNQYALLTPSPVRITALSVGVARTPAA